MVDVNHSSGYESGAVYNIQDHSEFAFISDITEGDPVSLIHTARSPQRPIPSGVTVFKGSEGGRDALVRAELWGKIHDRVPLDEPLEYRADIDDDCQRACVPAVIAGDGAALVAAYLAAHGFDNDAIATALNVGNRTVSQYITDFRAGER